MKLPIATLALFACASAGHAQTDPQGPVIGVGPFLHMVADLDKSIAFYRDTLGLKLNGPAGDHPFNSNPAVANLYGVPGKQFRAAVLAVPGSDMGIELAQWQGAGSSAGTNPAMATLILHVKDASAFKTRARTKEATLHDPDGFPVELLETEAAPSGGEILGAELRIKVPDKQEASVRLAQVFGFTRGAHPEALGIPGSSVGITFAEGQSSDALGAPFPSPGHGMLRLRVRNIDALAKACQSAGFKVITAEGKPVDLGGGARAIIVRDPVGFYFQPFEPATPRAAP